LKIRGSNVPLVGVIKEVAPTKQAADDTVLGVQVFQRDYLGGAELYLDAELAFYAYFGGRKLITPGLLLRSLANPFKAWRTIKAIGARMTAKSIEGNMIGEGNLLGGVLVVSPQGDVVYEYAETTGEPAPLEAIELALDELERR